MSKLDDLIQGVKNMPNDNYEYDKQKFKELMLEIIGKDSNPDPVDLDFVTGEDVEDLKLIAENELKAELRQKVTEL